MRASVAWRAAAVVATLGAVLPGHVQARSGAPSVFYHDQSGTVLSGVSGVEAARLASRHLGFTVRLPSVWPSGAPLRALWVMDHQSPRFVVLYYGGDDGYITCQLHESLHPARASLHWGTRTSITIGPAHGTLLRSGKGNPFELIWWSRGVYYDLLGSGELPVSLLVHMATSLI